jgi:hypothetical protein
MKLNAILCITKATRDQPHALNHHAALAEELGWQYFVGLDNQLAGEVPKVWSLRTLYMNIGGASKGYFESMLEVALGHLMAEVGRENYVLRLDDDELVSPSMRRWLLAGGYRAADHWKFSRAHLWGDADHYIAAPPLWPDHQTRLSTWAKSGGRPNVHDGSPFGGGELAPCGPILHAKFLMKSLDERLAIAAKYDAAGAGKGTSPGMLPFQAPERVWPSSALATPKKDYVGGLLEPVGAFS